jgi:UPF0716 family protein affecting phage T7 exclusion
VLLALTVDTAKNILLAIILLLIVVAVLVAKYVSSVGAKALIILVIGGVILGVWTQRQALSDCASELQEKYRAGDTSSTQCSFFGTTVEVPGT